MATNARNEKITNFVRSGMAAEIKIDLESSNPIPPLSTEPSTLLDLSVLGQKQKHFQSSASLTPFDKAQKKPFRLYASYKREHFFRV
jgi:hypothetical protein